MSKKLRRDAVKAWAIEGPKRAAERTRRGRQFVSEAEIEDYETSLSL